MKLTIKHLAGYLPYGLKVQYEGILNGKELSEYKKIEPKGDYLSKEYQAWIRSHPKPIEGLKITEIKGVKFFKNYTTIHVGRSFAYSKTVFCSNIKPLLRPLSQLTQEIEVGGVRFVPSIEYVHLRFEEISTMKGGDRALEFIKVREQEVLFELHFDYYGLIEAGLAIEMEVAK